MHRSVQYNCKTFQLKVLVAGLVPGGVAALAGVPKPKIWTVLAIEKSVPTPTQQEGEPGVSPRQAREAAIANCETPWFWQIYLAVHGVPSPTYPKDNCFCQVLRASCISKFLACYPGTRVPRVPLGKVMLKSSRRA
eukprot:3856423-Rhodomonas_salina.1